MQIIVNKIGPILNEIFIIYSIVRACGSHGAIKCKTIKIHLYYMRGKYLYINVIIILYGLLNLYIAFYFKWILNEFIFIKIFDGIFHNPSDLRITNMRTCG